jgi:hypothetical protein
VSGATRGSAKVSGISLFIFYFSLTQGGAGNPAPTVNTPAQTEQKAQLRDTIAQPHTTRAPTQDANAGGNTQCIHTDPVGTRNATTPAQATDHT